MNNQIDLKKIIRLSWFTLIKWKKQQSAALTRGRRVLYRSVEAAVAGGAARCEGAAVTWTTTLAEPRRPPRSPSRLHPPPGLPSFLFFRSCFPARHVLRWYVQGNVMEL